MRKLLCSLVVLIMIVSWFPASFATNSKPTISFSTSMDAATTVDRLIRHALRRLGTYGMDIEVFPMAYAIQMANSGEKDALVAQLAGLEMEHPNLVMVPEQIAEVRFGAYAQKGFSGKINGWEDLAGLRVGTTMHKTYLESRLPPDVGGHIFRDSNAELIRALLADECDVFIVTVSLNDELQIPEGISRVCELERLPTYVYLNKRYEALAPLLAQAIADIKKDGSYQSIAGHEETKGTRKKRVLHISSYYSDDPWEEELIDGARAVFAGNADIQYENIALNSDRTLNEGNRTRIASSMVRTAGLDGAPDVVIASDNAAIQFVMDCYNVLFYGVPIVFCGQNGSIDDQLWKINGNGTGVYERIPIEENVRLILDLFPDTEQLFILNDHSATGTEWKKEAEIQLGTMPEAKGLDIVFNQDAPLSEIEASLDALPENSVVLCGAYSFDADNRYDAQKEMQKALSGVGDLPVFGMRYGSIGYGQIGGRYVEPRQQGEAAANIAVAVLGGQDIRTIPTLRDTAAFNGWTFDCRVLARFGIHEKRLPTGSLFINKLPTLYERNPWTYVLTVLLLVMSFVTVIVLSILVRTIHQKNKRLVAVLKNLHSTEELLEKDREIVAIAQRLEIALSVSDAGAWEINPRTGLLYYDKMVAKALFISSSGCISIPQLVETLTRIQEGFIGSETHRALLTGELGLFEQLNGTSIALMEEDGTLRYYRFHTKVMPGDMKQSGHVIGLLIDITADRRIQQELTEAKEAAEEANLVKSQFLSNMSHEIRTPMNAIVGMTELLAIEPLTEKQRQFVRDISTSSDWLLRLINDLLDLSKIESGKLV